MQGKRSAEGTGAHGRYYAEYVKLTGEDPQYVQSLLDEKDGREWHLVGVAGGLAEGDGVLFWDTQRPGFGRRSV